MKYIKGFNGLRFISISLVIINHLGLPHHFESDGIFHQYFSYFFSGGAGVNVFFAISGFLITTILLNEKAKYGTVNLKNFFAKRFIRLLPPVIPFYIALYVFMQLGYVRKVEFGLLISLFYLFNFVPKAKAFWSTELSHTWSLAVEEQFYLIWSILFKWLNRNKIIFIGISLILISIVFSLIVPSQKIDLKGSVMSIQDAFFIERWTIPAISPIIIGALIAIFNFKTPETAKSITNNKLYITIASVFFCSSFFIPNEFSILFNLPHSIGVSLFLLWIVHHQTHVFITWLEWKPIRYLGTISYGIYIWQGFFIRTSSHFEPKIQLHEWPLNLLLTLIISILSYEILEKRVLNLKKYFKN